MKNSVTSELKSIVRELGLTWFHSYSDNRAKNSVGVKLVGTYLTDDQMHVVRQKMIDKGFGFRYIRVNDKGFLGHCNGTRFCFIKK
jgi:Zn-dependent M16 (insulinase) family peptidase